MNRLRGLGTLDKGYMTFISLSHWESYDPIALEGALKVTNAVVDAQKWGKMMCVRAALT
jgi:hypothetical protein